MIRILNICRSLADLENVPVMAKNGTAVVIKDLGRVSFGADIWTVSRNGTGMARLPAASSVISS